MTGVGGSQQVGAMVGASRWEPSGSQQVGAIMSGLGNPDGNTKATNSENTNMCVKGPSNHNEESAFLKRRSQVISKDAMKPQSRLAIGFKQNHGSVILAYTIAWAHHLSLIHI